jgi:hypothetical protein
MSLSDGRPGKTSDELSLSRRSWRSKRRDDETVPVTEVTERVRWGLKLPSAET